MFTLAIDTSSNDLSIALLNGNKVVDYLDQTMERGQGEVLLPLIQDLLTRGKIKASDLTAVAVAVGPGSFTGVRVALATARGIGLALDIPVYGVTNFEAAAYGLDRAVTVVLDSKRGDYFTQSFDQTGHPIDAPRIQSSDALKQKLPFTAAGNGAEQLHQEIGCDTLEKKMPTAVAVAHVALSRTDHALAPEPLYLREADVTI